MKKQIIVANLRSDYFERRVNALLADGWIVKEDALRAAVAEGGGLVLVVVLEKDYYETR